MNPSLSVTWPLFLLMCLLLLSQQDPAFLLGMSTTPCRKLGIPAWSTTSVSNRGREMSLHG